MNDIAEALQCTHSKLPEVAFDKAACAGKDARWVRQHYPRGENVCPDCKQVVLQYASFLHYHMGDW